MARPNWKKALDFVSDKITLAEDDMQERFCVMPAEAGSLRWSRENASGRFRIMRGDKPLMEAPIADRAALLAEIEVLKDAADAAMAKVAQTGEDDKDG